MENKCLDIRGGNISAGTLVQLYDCNGSAAQQWYFDGLYLRVPSNPNFCLDAGGGLNSGASMLIWWCQNSVNQRWVAGTNDFQTQRYATIYATPNGFLSFYNQNWGHSFVSFDNDYNKSIEGTTNTFSAWGNQYSQDTNSSNIGQLNNMGDYDAIQVDFNEPVNGNDWGKAADFWKYNTLSGNWRARIIYLSKPVSDLYRYNSKFRLFNGSQSVMVTYIYVVAALPGESNTAQNCTTAATKIWKWLNIDMGYSNNVPYVQQPVDVFNAL